MIALPFTTKADPYETILNFAGVTSWMMVEGKIILTA